MDPMTDPEDAGYYPTEDEGNDEPVSTTVQLPPDLHADLKFIADLWNAFDEARGLKKRSKWKPATVIRRLLLVGRGGIARQLGGIPKGEKARAEFIASTAKKVAEKTGPSK